MLVAVVFALVPVSVTFGNDPLLRLRELDPELSPPPNNAHCGSPVRSLDVAPADTSLHELARANACEDAARRRLAAAVAGGAVLFVFGLVGRVASSPAPERPSRLQAAMPVRSGKGGLPSD
ncbi:MAG TPA: hypothetical protein VF045_03915 [Acidimicrobiales bacterium]